MKKKLYIIGAGSVGGHVALNLTEYSKDFQLEGFFDDDPEKVGTEQYGYPVIGTISDANKLQDVALVIGIAFPKIKSGVIEKLSINNSVEFPSLIHHKAWVSNDVEIGKGVVIYPGATINYGSVIGDFVVLNMNCALGHHTKIGNYSSFAPGVKTGGHTTVEKLVDVGIGVSTLQNITIGSHSTIGGQAMVIEDIPPKSTAVGIPARVIGRPS